MSDEIWADSQGEQSVPATAKTTDVSALALSIQRSLSELDAQPTGRDAVTQVLAWLRDLAPHRSTGDDEALSALGSQYAQWTREALVISDALWFQVAEIGAWLAIHGDETPLRAFQTTSLRSVSMPHKDAYCDRQRQVHFSTQLFDALCGAVVARLTARTALLVVEVFTSRLVHVMGDYEFIFLHHIAQPLVAHIQQKLRVLPDTVAYAAQSLAESQIAKNWQAQASSIAVACVLLSTSSQGSAIKAVQSLVAEKLQAEKSLPHVHDSVAVLAVSLQAAPLAVASSPLVHQFILLRVIHLTLISPRLLINQDDYRRLSERYQEALYRSQISEREVGASLRMMDAATDEIQAAMNADPAVSSSILQTMRSRSEVELFRPSLITLQEQLEKRIGSSEQSFPATQFLGNVYDAMTIAVQALSQSPSTSVVIHCFLILCRLEFARECCATPQRNGIMVLLTQRVEDLIESNADATLTALSTSVLSRQSELTSKASQDVAFGWACLAIGQIVQRKLRIVLFQAGETARREAFAVVFAGLYHGLEPLDSFTHRFLTFTLSSLGQFVSVYEMFPFYMQETLRRFPSDAPKQQTANVLGTVFGALYYTNPSPALTEEEKRIEATATETRHAMILWALRQTSERTKALLPVDGDDSSSADDGLYMAELFFEVAKMAPVDLLPTVAREMEALVEYSAKISTKMLREVKTRVFNAVSANCEAEKRAWLAAWFLELSAAYPTPEAASIDDVVVDATEATASQSPQAVSRL